MTVLGSMLLLFLKEPRAEKKFPKIIIRDEDDEDYLMQDSFLTTDGRSSMHSFLHRVSHVTP